MKEETNEKKKDVTMVKRVKKEIDATAKKERAGTAQTQKKD